MNAEQGADALPDLLPEHSGGALQAAGASWPDVGIALVEFAREDTLRFVVALSVFGFVVWALYPRRSELFQALYRSARHRAKEKSSNSGDASHD